MQGDPRAQDSPCVQPSPDLKLLWKADTQKDAYYSSQKYHTYAKLSEKM